MDLGVFIGEEITASVEASPGEFIFGFNNGIQKMTRYEVETLYQGEGNPQIPNEGSLIFRKTRMG
ncbi:hypothetical protein [Algoriphagus boritolerans]|uniref:hypothetical protein n=1 Tax=Algoriphagus boritolerans TaxID=308111 RepID=UPI000A4610FB